MKNKILLPVLGVVLIATGFKAYKSDFFEISKQLEIFTDAYKEINMNYVDEVNPAELMDVAIKAMFEHLDPYTNFWNEQEVKEGRLVNSGNYSGIGANIQSEKNQILIKEIFKNQPADKAGLKAGDKIIKIGDTQVEDFEDDAGELLKGAPGTSVELSFKRQNETKNTTLERESVQPKLVPFHKKFDENIGYIKLTEFGKTAAQEVKDALNDLKSQGAEKIILDLRGNPGGLLTEAVHISNLFLPKDQLIVSTQSIIDKYNKTYKTKNEPVDTEIPLTVLVDAHSASASEIVSGSLQDLDRAVVIGAQSFGKGLVQRVKPMKYQTQMKVTISRYYIPSGRGIQALDYWERDENGKPVRTKKEDYKAYQTKGGRTVYDAGGITPDIKVEESEVSAVTQALLNQNVIFDFATNYYYDHQDLDDVDNFKLSNQDFNSFKDYLQQIDFQYESETEKELNKAFTQTEDDDFKEEIQKEYDKFLEKINQKKKEEIDKNEKQIRQQLTNDILKRYFYQDGFYKYSLKHHPEIREAVKILNNKNKYQSILN